MRQDVLHELALTGRRVPGGEACQLGLVTRVSETPLELAREIARDIASRSPRAVAAARELFAKAPTLTPRERLALEARLQQELLGSAEQREAATAKVERRLPRFD